MSGLRSDLAAFIGGADRTWASFAVRPEQFLDCCREHEVAPLVHQRLISETSYGGWPQQMKNELGRMARDAAAAELARGREVALVLQLLAGAGVHPVLLKGVALAHTVYPSPGLRPRADTDFIVAREQIDAVRRALIEGGYAEPPASAGEILFRQFQMVRTDQFGLDHAFDCHWNVSTQPDFANVLTFDELAAEATTIPSLGPRARGPSMVHALLLACIHPVMHHRNHPRLIWILDIHLLAARLSDVDFDRFAGLAVARKVAAICLHQLLAARATFGTAVPDRVLRTLSEHEPAERSAIYLQAGRRWHDELASSLGGLPAVKDRARLLREVLLPGPTYMRQRYRLRGVALALLPFAYLHRGLTGAAKIVARRK